MGCKKDKIINSNEISYGKNVFTTSIDGYEREYLVHIPLSYDATADVPVVFMLHGTSGDGLKFYNISGWTEVGETENIITVFPSSGRHCIIEGGLEKNTTKWNIQPAANWSYCPGEVPLDDIAFFEKIITELSTEYTIDTKKIYLVGFSNGGQMAAKCSIIMGDKFAAIVQNSGSFKYDTTYIPIRKLPIIYQRGNIDYGAGGTGPEFPLSDFGDSILYNHLFNRIAKTHVNSFELDPNFIISGDNTKSVTAKFSPLGLGYEFNMILVKGLGHSYPNGTNHWMKGAEEHWQWLKQFSIP